MNAYQVSYLGAWWPGVPMPGVQQRPDDLVWIRSSCMHIHLLIPGHGPDGDLLGIITSTSGNSLEGALEIPWRANSPEMGVFNSFLHSLNKHLASAYCVPGTVLGGKNSKINRT